MFQSVNLFLRMVYGGDETDLSSVVEMISSSQFGVSLGFGSLSADE